MPTKTAARRHINRKTNPPHIALPRNTQKGRFSDIAGCLSDKDAEELRTIVAESCERINGNEW